MSYECEARPTCPACGAAWSEEMVSLFDAILGMGCSCCNPYADQLPDIACHACKKVLYTWRGATTAGTAPGEAVNSVAPELDLTPDPE